MKNSLNLSSIPFGKLRIPLSLLGGGVSTFTFLAVNPDLSPGYGCRFQHPIEITAHVTSGGGNVLVELEVESEGEFLCDRCGVEYKRVIRGTAKTLFTFDCTRTGVEEKEDTRCLSPAAQEIDITQDVRDAFLLAVPTKHLCREDCLGLCPRCGANLNFESCSCPKDDIDPRWKVLKGLKLD